MPRETPSRDVPPGDVVPAMLSRRCCPGAVVPALSSRRCSRPDRPFAATAPPGDLPARVVGPAKSRAGSAGLVAHPYKTWPAGLPVKSRTCGTDQTRPGPLPPGCASTKATERACGTKPAARCLLSWLTNPINGWFTDPPALYNHLDGLIIMELTHGLHVFARDPSRLPRT